MLQVPLQIDNAPTCMFLYRSTQLQDACCSTERQSLILQVLLQIHSFRILVALQRDKASSSMFFCRQTVTWPVCSSTERHSFRMLVALQRDKVSSCMFLYRYTASGCLLLYRGTRSHPACSSTDTQLQDACCSTEGQGLILHVLLQIDNASTFSVHAALQTDKASAFMFLYRETKPYPACYLHRYDRECLQIASTIFCSSTRQADHNIHMLLCSSTDGKNGCVI